MSNPGSAPTALVCPPVLGPRAAGVVIDESMHKGPPSGYWLAVAALADGLRRTASQGHFTLAAARPAREEEILAVHSSDYVDRVARLSRGPGGEVGPHTWIEPGGFRVVSHGVGAAVSAVEAVLRGEAKRAYALAFPAGHHATRGSGGGWCVFNNVAIAAHVAKSWSAGRLMILDLDVHHGNGTQSAFWSDPSVLTVSVHQDQAFEPGTGGIDATGGGSAVGANMNIPLPAGAGLGAYLHAWERLIAPAATSFEPDLMLVSCGLDASAADPMGRMRLHAQAFHRLIREVCALAETLCGGRVVLCHEGGYSAAYSPLCGLSAVRALAGGMGPAEDPFMSRWRLSGRDELKDYEKRIIDGMTP